MLGPTHKVFGVAFTTSALFVANYIPENAVLGGIITNRSIPEDVLIISSSIIGSSIVDLDVIGRKFKIDLLSKITHRGLTHTIYPVILLIYLTYILNYTIINAILLGITLGYLSHLIADAYSKAGIAWFNPFTGYITYASGAFHVKGKRHIFPPIYKVGSKIFGIKAIYIWLIITTLIVYYYFKIALRL